MRCLAFDNWNERRRAGWGRENGPLLLAYPVFFPLSSRSSTLAPPPLPQQLLKGPTARSGRRSRGQSMRGPCGRPVASNGNRHGRVSWRRAGYVPILVRSHVPCHCSSACGIPLRHSLPRYLPYLLGALGQLQQFEVRRARALQVQKRPGLALGGLGISTALCCDLPESLGKRERPARRRQGKWFLMLPVGECVRVVALSLDIVANGSHLTVSAIQHSLWSR